MEFIKLIRVKQWVKNLFVFVAAFFSGRAFERDVMIQSFIAFILFCLVSSCVYILNDYADIEKDRLHPTKKFRPLASGKISKSSAIILFVVLLLISAIGLFMIGSPSLTLILGIYFFINILYSFGLKQVAILDIFIIALGFLLRVLAGGAAIDVQVTDWAILLNFVLALVLAAGKRRGELKNVEITGVTRKSLSGYNVAFLDIILAISCTVTIVCYIMFTLSEEVQQRFNHNIIYTVVFVVLGVFRYLQLALVYDRSESPTRILYKDHFIKLTLILWITSFILLIYFK